MHRKLPEAATVPPQFITFLKCGALYIRAMNRTAIMTRKKMGGPMDFQGGRDNSPDQGISFLSIEGVSQDQINHSHGVKP